MLGAAAHPATAYLSHQDSKDQGTLMLHMLDMPSPLYSLSR